MRRAHLAFREQLTGMVTVVDISLEPFLAAGASALPGSVGGGAAGGIRRLPCRPAGLDPSGGARHSARWPEVHRGRRFRRTAAARRTQGGRRPVVAAHGRAGGPHHRYHLHRRRGAGAADRLQHDARPLHTLRQSARPARRRNPARDDRRRPALQRDAARRGIVRRHRARACRADPRRAARTSFTAPHPPNRDRLRGVEQ